MGDAVGEDETGRAAELKMEQRLNRKKVWLRGELERQLLEGGTGQWTPESVLASLSDRLKTAILYNWISKEIALYGEPIHTVQELLSCVERETEYSHVLSDSDVLLIKDFLSCEGVLLSSCSVPDPPQGVEGEGGEDEVVTGLQLVAARLGPQSHPSLQLPLLDFLEDFSSEPQPTYATDLSTQPELQLPEHLQKYFKLVDDGSRRWLNILFGLTERQEPSDRSHWLSKFCKEQLGLVVVTRWSSKMNEDKLEEQLPILLASSNVIERHLNTVIFFGYIGGLGSTESTYYTRKRLFCDSLTLGLAVHLAALQLIKTLDKSQLFNIKMVLLPKMMSDESATLAILTELADALTLCSSDYLVQMNGAETHRLSPVSSGLGQRLYSCSVFLPSSDPAFHLVDTMERLKILLFAFMDRIKHYKYFNKHKKNLQSVYKGEKVSEEPRAKVCFSAVKEVDVDDVQLSETEEEGPRMRLKGWRTDIKLKFYLPSEEITSAITEVDIESFKETMRSKDPLLKRTFLEVRELEECNEYESDGEYQSLLYQLMSLAQLRTADRETDLSPARSLEPLPLARALQTLYNKDSIIFSFGCDSMFRREGIIFTEVRQAVRLVTSLLLVLRSEGRPPLGSNVEVSDVTALLNIPLHSCLEVPYPANSSSLDILYRHFQSGLKKVQIADSKKKPPESSISGGEPITSVDYFSKSQLAWMSGSLPSSDNIRLAQRYEDLMKWLLQMKGSTPQSGLTRIWISFICYLLYKSRRSSIISKYSKVKKSLTNEGEAAANDADINIENKLDHNKIPNGKILMGIVKYLMAGLSLDGSLMNELFNLILYENKVQQNEKIMKKIVSALINETDKTADKSITLINYPLMMKILQNKTYNFDHCIELFSRSIVLSEEEKSFALLESLKKFCFSKTQLPLKAHSFRGSLLEGEGHYQDSIEVVSSEKDDEAVMKLSAPVEDGSASLLESGTHPASPVTLSALRPYYRPSSWYTIYMYLIRKAKRGMTSYNELWKLYKETSRSLTSGEPLVTPPEGGRGGDSPFLYTSSSQQSVLPSDETTLNYLRDYIKYCLITFENCFHLYWSLEDLYRLYMVMPDFAEPETYFTSLLQSADDQDNSWKADFLHTLASSKELWTQKSNSLHLLETILLSNHDCTSSPEVFQRRFARCLERLQIVPPEPKLLKPALYPLNQRKVDIFNYLSKFKERCDRLKSLISDERLKLYYSRLSQSYQIIFNTLDVIIYFQDNIYDVIAKRPIKVILRKFPFLPDSHWFPLSYWMICLWQHINRILVKLDHEVLKKSVK